MRTVLMAIVFLVACSATAQSETRYDLYILQPHDGGAAIYAFTGGGSAAALEVRDCGDVRLLPEAGAIASRLSARRSADDIDVVTVVARNSRTHLGPCRSEDVDHEADEEDEED